MIEDVFLFTMVESIKLIITGQNTFYLLPLMQQLKMLHEKKINIPPISVRLFLNPSFRAEISDMSCHIYYTHTVLLLSIKWNSFVYTVSIFSSFKNLTPYSKHLSLLFNIHAEYYFNNK